MVNVLVWQKRKEEKANNQKVFSFNNILLIIAIPNPNFIQNELDELIVQFSSLIWHQLVASVLAPRTAMKPLQ